MRCLVNHPRDRSQIMVGQVGPCSATWSAPKIAVRAAFEQVLVVINQHKRTKTVVASLKPGSGVIGDLMLVQHDAASGEQSRA